jgi:hypothetical protein
MLPRKIEGSAVEFCETADISITVLTMASREMAVVIRPMEVNLLSTPLQRIAPFCIPSMGLTAGDSQFQRTSAKSF